MGLENYAINRPGHIKKWIYIGKDKYDDSVWIYKGKVTKYGQNIYVKVRSSKSLFDRKLKYYYWKFTEWNKASEYLHYWGIKY